MSVVRVHSLTFRGLQAVPVTIEVHLSAGLPAFTLVGLPSTEVRESRERVRSALINSGFEFPCKRMTVNLAPADLPKDSASFDLAIAVGIAQASGQLNKADLEHWIFTGELSLTGALTNCRSPFALAASVQILNNERMKQSTTPLKLMLPAAQASSCAGLKGLQAFGAPNLFEAAAHLAGYGKGLTPVSSTLSPLFSADSSNSELPATAIQAISAQSACLSDVIGQESAKKALLTACAGHHHLRLVGSPGSGKSMLAQRLPGLLPELPEHEALLTSSIRSLKGEAHHLSGTRPWRNPHCGSSMPALIGGGNPPAPGEITLAHQGVLFTDEVLEFDRRILEALREPLETGQINLSRAGHQISYPARFLWVCAHNPCPCGWLGHPVKRCGCTPEQIRRYRNRLSGPLLDRLDLSVEVNPIPAEHLLAHRDSVPTAPEAATQIASETRGTSSPEMRHRVNQARNLQLNRQGCLNGELDAKGVATYCELEPAARTLLTNFAGKHHWSSRALHRACRVARTLADLDDSPAIERGHVAAAIQYRKSLQAEETNSS